MTSFSSIYGLSGSATSLEQQHKLKSTLNSALEIKLKMYSSQVVKYLNKTNTVESAQLEFIMDLNGLVYLLDLRRLNSIINLGVFHSSSQKVRLRSSISRRHKRDNLKSDKTEGRIHIYIFRGEN